VSDAPKPVPNPLQAAIKRAVDLLWPWVAIVVGLYAALRLPMGAWQGLWGWTTWPRGTGQVLGLLYITCGSFALGWRLFVAVVPHGTFSRPLGQMVVGTLVNCILTLGLTWCALKIGATINAGDPTRAPLDGRTLGIGAALFVAQGIALPLYAWWRWSGDRDMEKIEQTLQRALVKALQESSDEAQLRQRAVQHEKRTDNAEP